MCLVLRGAVTPGSGLRGAYGVGRRDGVEVRASSQALSVRHSISEVVQRGTRTIETGRELLAGIYRRFEIRNKCTNVQTTRSFSDILRKLLGLMICFFVCLQGQRHEESLGVPAEEERISRQLSGQ